MAGTSLKSIEAAFQARVSARAKGVVTPAGVGQRAGRRVEERKLTVTVGGTEYPIFILGAHDPDDTATARYVP